MLSQPLGDLPALQLAANSATLRLAYQDGAPQLNGVVEVSHSVADLSQLAATGAIRRPPGGEDRPEHGTIGPTALTRENRRMPSDTLKDGRSE